MAWVDPYDCDSATRRSLSWAELFVWSSISSGAGAWPKWLHEGLAVWVELQKGGRGHSGIIDLQLRELAEYEHNENKSAFESFHLDGGCRS